MKDIPLETLDLARELRAQGQSWNAVGRAVGLFGETIRYRLDDVYALKTRQARKGPLSRVYVPSQRLSDAEVQRRLDTVPLDTRSRNAKLFGDPLPGRSALDQKKNALPVHSGVAKPGDLLTRGFHGFISKTAIPIPEAVE